MERQITEDMVMLANAAKSGDRSALDPLCDCTTENGWVRVAKHIWNWNKGSNDAFFLSFVVSWVAEKNLEGLTDFEEHYWNLPTWFVDSVVLHD